MSDTFIARLPYHTCCVRTPSKDLVLSTVGWVITKHYSDVIMGAMASQIISLTIVYSTVYSGTDQWKYQSSASLAFVRRIHRWPGNSPQKWRVTLKMFSFDDVIVNACFLRFSAILDSIIKILTRGMFKCRNCPNGIPMVYQNQWWHNLRYIYMSANILVHYESLLASLTLVVIEHR